jgi:iron complex transport system substrate-binding protein
VFDDVIRIGAAAGCEGAAREVVEGLEAKIDGVRKSIGPSVRAKRVVCLEWLQPMMYAGHWVPEMIDAAGGTDCLGRAGLPSRRVEWEEVVAQKPEVLLLAPCGFDVERGLQEMPLLTGLPGWNSLPAVQSGQVFVANSNAYFTRSGPRLVEGMEILAKVLHPELFEERAPRDAVVRYEEA